MAVDLRGRDFLKEVDFTRAEIRGLLDLAANLKIAGRFRTQHLERKKLALIFEKTSTRTRAAFEVGAFNQGMMTTFLEPTTTQIGHKESVEDTARLLSRMYDGIQYRGKSQAVVETLAEFSPVPVFNGLTDEWHPTQMLADFLTMREHAGTDDESQISYAYLGDARNNMGNSLLVTGAILGSDVRLVAPKELWPEDTVVALAQKLAAESGAKITLTESVTDGVRGAQFLHTDVWVSMGEAKEVWAQRVELLRDYQVNLDVLKQTERADAKFMHCLPAYHDSNTTVGREMAEKFGMTNGIEVSSDLFDSSRNIAFDQAENRLHTIEAVLVATMGDQTIDELIVK
jgi:ornithine carbamoyltransferase